MGEIGNPARLEGRRPFVGRDREVAELAAALEDAVGGRRCLFLVAGEPGIGKTWLAEHLSERALRRGFRVLWGRCDDPSLLLLRFLARDLRGGSLLVVGLYREVEAERRPGISDAVGDLVREGHLVNLRGLGRDEVRALIEGLSGIVPSEAKVAAIHQTTKGNPLFIREAVRLLASDATLEHPGRGGRADSG